MRPLTRLLRPRNVAVFGGAWARETIRQLQRFGYAGEIWPVHPEKPAIEGLPAYASLEHLPEAPDAAFIGINRKETIRLVDALNRKGAGGAVCFASGYAEVGDEGAALQTALVAAAGDMPVLGPNAYGYINAFDRSLLWPDLHGCSPQSRGVAIIAQSSNIAINLTMARRALPIGYVICLGNQAVIGQSQAIRAVADDERVSVIALHIEAIAEGFADAVEYAKSRGKHFVALRAGRSESSRRIAQSHTASLAGASAVATAFLRRLGVAEVDTIPQLLETAKLLHALGPLGGAGLVTLSCSGGEAGLIADHAERAGVALASFSEARRRAIEATVNPLVQVSNPFDYHTFDWGARERLEPTFLEVMRSGQSATALALDWPRAELGPAPGWDIALDAFVAAARTSGVTAMVVATVPECLPEDRAAALVEAGVAPMQGLEEMMAAVRAATAIGRTGDSAPLLPPLVLHGASRSLDEAEAKARLAAFGVAVPDGVVCGSLAEAVAAVERLAPAAMKAVSPEILHKTELGAVRLNVMGADAARVFEDLARLSPRVLVERMAGGGVAELIVGAARDPALGWHLILGAGGVLAELLADRAILMLPTNEVEIRAALSGLKIDRLISGYRGKPPANRDALVSAILRLAEFACGHSATLEEFEVNPLIATPESAIAVDCLMKVLEP